MKRLFFLLLVVNTSVAYAQIPDHTYKSNIHTVKLHKYGDIYSYPVLTLNGNDQLELHFDDMDADIKYY